MEKIIKKRIREQIYSETQSRPFTMQTFYDLYGTGNGIVLSDEFSFDYSEDNDGKYTYTLWVYRWRDETDEELQIRVDRAKQTMPDTIIKELKEIKNKHNELLNEKYGKSTE